MEGADVVFILRGVSGGPGLEGEGIFPSENYGKTRVLGPGAAPPAPVCTQSGEERISGKRKNLDGFSA